MSYKSGKYDGRISERRRRAAQGDRELSPGRLRVYELMREAFDVLNTSKGSSIVLTTTRRDLSTVDALKFIVASCHDLADDDKRSELKERVTKMTGLTDRQYSRWIKTDVGEIITLYMLGLYDPFVLLDGALDTYVKNEGRNV